MSQRDEDEIEAPGVRTRPAGGGDLLRYAGTLLLVGAGYYVAGRLGLRLALIQQNVTPLWPPTGIAVAAFVTFGLGIWPAVAVAAFLVNLPISTTPLAAAVTALGNTLAPLAAAVLLARVGFRREIDRLRDAVAVVFLGALLAMLISAAVGTGTLVASGAIPHGRFWSAAAVWWAGDAMGVLVVAPFLLSLGARRGSPLPGARVVELVVVLFLVAAASIAVMGTTLPLAFLVIPVLGWAAWRFQQQGAAPAALLAAGIASWATAHDVGPFGHGTLLERMLSLQAFNATVALSSLFFAAVVTDRQRARDALQQAAGELEERVKERTAELSTANAQLADAQQVARIGSWEWWIPESRVSWSDEMFRIHGYAPHAFTVTLDKALELVMREDAARIQANVDAALREGRDHELPDIEYRIVRPDGSVRTLVGSARLSVEPSGSPLRMVGSVQDVTDARQAARERQVAETLQRSLLPERLPEIPGIALAARYVPASIDVEVGGDWYDVLSFPDGTIGLAIGDVAGRGLRAASTMGQLRMGLRAYALEETGSPAAVLHRAHRLALTLPTPEIATLLYLVFDPDSGTIRFASAGHLPPLLIDPTVGTTYLEGGLAPPLGAGGYTGGYPEVTASLPSGSTLLLYTDGLVETRGVSLDDGLARLREEVRASVDGLESLCDHLLRSMVGQHISDDIALLALRPLSLGEEPLRMQVLAEPAVLAPVRHTIRRWLAEVRAEPRSASEILLACGEACTNVVQHAYGGRAGTLDIELGLVAGTVAVTVRDRGRWRSGQSLEKGWGLALMRDLMDEVEIGRDEAGTVVRMRRSLLPDTHA